MRMFWKIQYPSSQIYHDVDLNLTAVVAPFLRAPSGDGRGEAIYIVAFIDDTGALDAGLKR